MSATVVEGRIPWAIYLISVAVDMEGKTDAAVGWFRLANHIRVVRGMPA